MANIMKLCSPVPLLTRSETPPSYANFAVLSKKLWTITDGKVCLRCHFLDGPENKKTAVKNTIQTWSAYANVTFEYTDERASSDIRISFQSPIGLSWGADPARALGIAKEKPTLNLGWIADSEIPSAEDRGTILHEFGHALGMMHEHQSPARGMYIHLKELAVYNYYRPLLNYDDQRVKSQVIDKYNLSEVSNYSCLDLNSIMMYFMPGDLNEEGIDIPVNLDLSDLDKAFITLSYPRKEAAEDGLSVLRALDIAGVPEDVAGDILASLAADKLDDVRKKFQNYNLSVMRLVTTNKDFLKSADPTSGAQYGIKNSIAEVIHNPVFIGIMKGIVNDIFTRHTIPAVYSIPGTARGDIADTIGAIITSPAFAKTIVDLDSKFSGGPQVGATHIGV